MYLLTSYSVPSFARTHIQVTAASASAVAASVYALELNVATQQKSPDTVQVRSSSAV